MTYIIDGFFKHGELDSWETGCSTDETFSHDIDVKLKADTQAELIDMVKHHFNVNRDAITLNAGGEAGRVDIQLMENRNGEKATEAEIEEFRWGEIDLWLCDYSGTLEYILRLDWSEQ